MAAEHLLAHFWRHLLKSALSFKVSALWLASFADVVLDQSWEETAENRWSSKSMVLIHRHLGLLVASREPRTMEK